MRATLPLASGPRIEATHVGRTVAAAIAAARPPCLLVVPTVVTAVGIFLLPVRCGLPMTMIGLIPGPVAVGRPSVATSAAGGVSLVPWMIGESGPHTRERRR